MYTVATVQTGVYYSALRCGNNILFHRPIKNLALGVPLIFSTIRRLIKVPLNGWPIPSMILPSTSSSDLWPPVFHTKWFFIVFIDHGAIEQLKIVFFFTGFKAVSAMRRPWAPHHHPYTKIHFISQAKTRSIAELNPPAPPQFCWFTVVISGCSSSHCRYYLYYHYLQQGLRRACGFGYEGPGYIHAKGKAVVCNNHSYNLFHRVEFLVLNRNGQGYNGTLMLLLH